MPVALENFTPARAGRDFLYVAGGLPLGIAWFTFLVTALSVGLSLAIVTIGIPVLAVTLLIWRWGANTERQRAYSRALATRFTYTPQIVVDGAAQEVGSKRDEVEGLIAKATAKRADAPEIAVVDGRVRVGAGASAAPASVWVAYFRKSVANDVPRGENAGRRLATTNAVRELRLLGGWDGEPVELALGSAPPAGCDGGAILVQRPGPGAILAARVFDAAR